MLKPLPVRRTAEFEEIPARVSKYAIFTLKGVLYSVPSQPIGHRLMVRQYAQHVECWLGGQCVLSLPRARPLEGQRVGRSIDYRHLVGALKRKTGAFARWVLRDAAFPRVLSRCRLINVFGVGTDASSSNGTDLSCQCIKLVGKRQLDAAFQQELTVADHVHQFDVR